jgi:hypothetical protein
VIALLFTRGLPRYAKLPNLPPEDYDAIRGGRTLCGEWLMVNAEWKLLNKKTCRHMLKIILKKIPVKPSSVL